MTKFDFPILIECDEDNMFIVSCPMFKGCHSYGTTVGIAMENIEAVIEMCVQD
jgi:predicted RNase H-like HicB family nuclease